MQKKEIIEGLVKIGLNEKEAKVYLAALELGEATAQQIAAKAIVNRPTTYIAIESLTQRGMMSSFQKGKKRYFLAGKPKQLVFMIEQAKQSLIEKEKEVAKLTDALDVYKDENKEETKVTAFQGFAGLRMLHENILNSDSDEFYEFIDTDAGRNYFPPPGQPDDIRTKIKKKFSSKRHTLYASDKGPILGSGSGNKLTYLPKNKYPVSDELLVYGDTVVFLAYEKELRGVMIKNASFANDMRILLKSLEDQGK